MAGGRAIDIEGDLWKRSLFADEMLGVRRRSSNPPPDAGATFPLTYTGVAAKPGTDLK